MRRTLVTLGLVAVAVSAWLALVFQATPGEGVRITEIYAVFGPKPNGACPPLSVPPPQQAAALEEGLRDLVTRSPDAEVPHPEFPAVTLRARSALPLVVGSLGACIDEAATVDPGWTRLLGRLRGITPGGA
jgi:hypothetical protein